MGKEFCGCSLWFEKNADIFDTADEHQLENIHQLLELKIFIMTRIRSSSE
jgi:hypothetical protein